MHRRHKLLIDLSVLTTDSRYRGIGRYAAWLAEGLATVAGPSSPYRVRVVEQLPWVGPGRVSDDVPGVLRRLLATGRTTEAHIRWAYRVRLRLAYTARRERPVLLHSPHPETTPIGRLGCPRIVTCHDLICLRFPRQYATSWKEGFATGRRLLDTRRFHRADHIIAVSECTARDLVDLLGVPRKKISVIHHGIDLSGFAPQPRSDDKAVRTRFKLGARPFLLYVGAGDWRKNALGMMRALSLAQRHPQGRELALVWAGSLSEKEHRFYRSLATVFGVKDSVYLLGYVENHELAALYREAVAKVFISLYEGFGYPVIEAMAAGCPVVAANRSAITEIAGAAAILVNPDEHHEVAAAIVDLLASSTLRAELKQRGLGQAAKFDIKRMAQQTLEVYEKVARL